MNASINKLLQQLRDELSELSDDELPRVRYEKVQKLTEAAHRHLQELIGDGRLSQAQEIELKKKVKPEIDSYRIEEAVRYNLMTNMPVGTDQMRRDYLEEELRAFQNFLKLNSFYYQYYKNDLDELDLLYFAHPAKSIALPIPEISDQSASHSSPMSSLFARFIAYERIQLYISRKLMEPDQDVQFRKVAGKAGEIRWTGEILGIVELIYGLWLTGQLNYGNASLNQIVRWFEVHFGVSIGIVQRRFSRIEQRKRLSVTKLLDQMKSAILTKIDEDQGL